MEWNYYRANENNTTVMHIPRDVDAPSYIEMHLWYPVYHKTECRVSLQESAKNSQLYRAILRIYVNVRLLKMLFNISVLIIMRLKCNLCMSVLSR